MTQKPNALIEDIVRYLVRQEECGRPVDSVTASELQRHFKGRYERYPTLLAQARASLGLAPTAVHPARSDAQERAADLLSSYAATLEAELTAKHEAEAADLRDKHADAQAEIDRLAVELSEAHHAIDSLRSELAEAEATAKKLEGLADTLTEVRITIGHLQADRSAVRNDFHALKGLVATEMAAQTAHFQTLAQETRGIAGMFNSFVQQSKLASSQHPDAPSRP